MNKRTEITAQTKQNLMDAFWNLYCEKRIEKITVKEITNKAGYNRGTFYEYFTDVYNVLDEIENSLIPSLDELPVIVN
ncbi:TetR/AcrR family transcriptional regulator [Alkalicella caledoniensis]|uniref:TetR/AcrR family transcriptional regulator n=1 Tax=Alkalicella caledoniensis TaxID=2731377 RepID=A0A7G9W9I4_ALKCA|nr:TetR/AcrR family transcriptional regulator [Alkalicella caledoniensis]QNO15346.1 TetR/AcrR family transcriptional regulator [Alkalicella caledoniensis]